MWSRSVLIAAAVVTAAIGSAAPAAAQPSITPLGGMSASPAPFPECPAGQDPESPGCIEKPDQNTSGATAQCRDGSYSHSQTHSGTCSGHHGVAQWCPCVSASGYLSRGAVRDLKEGSPLHAPWE